MKNIDWIKELVEAEQKMEDSGVVDFSAGFNLDKDLELESIEFLRDLKQAFVEAASTFNQLKGSSLGTVKIYGISKTRADFMLFRNGYKLIFTMKKPGLIAAVPHMIGSNFYNVPKINTSSPEKGDDYFESSWGPFGELKWTFKGQPIKFDYLVRYYLSRFIKESTK